MLWPWLPVEAVNRPASPLGLAQAGHQVEPAAHLERADGLVVLVLDPDLCTDELAEAGVVVQRRRPQVAIDVGAGGEDVVECGNRVVSHENSWQLKTRIKRSRLPQQKYL